jgi:imidazolonepropionase-like amidohydrolase
MSLPTVRRHRGWTRGLTILFAVAIIALAFGLCAVVVRGQASPTIAFIGVNVVPMDRERVSERQTVLVRDGKILEIGPATRLRVPPGSVVINAFGKYLMPGLAEMHSHIPGADAPEQAVRDLLFLYVANGITTIRGMLGAPNQLILRQQTARGQITGPTIFVGAPSLNGESAPTPTVGARLVREHKRAGYNFLKLHPGLTRAVYDSIVAVARRVGITFAGHVSVDVGLPRTLQARQSTIDHLDGYLEAAVPDSVRARATGAIPFAQMVAAVDTTRLRHWAGRARTARTWNVPTVFLWESFYSSATPEALARRAETRYASVQQVNGWIQQKRNMTRSQRAQGVTPANARRYIQLRRFILRALADSGAPLLMGTDSPQMFNVPGFSLHREIALLQEIGLTPYQILVSGTRNVAAYAAQDLRLDGAFGTIAVGKRADLLLLDANPLADARNVAKRAGVMVRGRWYSAAELDRGLEEMARRYRPAN